MNDLDLVNSELQVDINEATLAIKENRFSDAIKILEIALNKHPNHIDCLYLSAVSCRYLKDLEKSKEFVNRLLVEAPDMGRAYQELGHINREAGNDQQATQNYRQACELNSALIGSWNGLYDLFIKNNNKEAANHAKDQIDKIRSLPNTLLYIDQIMNEGRLGVAELKCRDYLKENPTNTYAMAQLSEIANRLGHFSDAETLLEKAVQFNPNDGDLVNAFGEWVKEDRLREKIMVSNPHKFYNF